jgi:adenosylhomocysteine nucleosidase
VGKLDGKRCAIITPMPIELHPFLKAGYFSETEIAAGLKVRRIKFLGVETLLAVSGIGKVNAASAAQLLIDRWEVDTLFLTGIAGTLAPDLHVGDVVIADSLYHYDAAIFRPGQWSPSAVEVRTLRGEFRRTNALHSNAQLVTLAQQQALGVSYPYITAEPLQIRIGPIVSGDALIFWPELLGRLYEQYGALAIDMESAAVAQIAMANDVNFLAVRGISDRAGEWSDLPLERLLASPQGRSEGVRQIGMVASSLVRHPRSVVELLRISRAMSGAARNAAALTIALIGKLAEAN